MGNKPEKQSENQYIETKRNSQTGSSVDGNLPLVQNESAVGVSEGETIKRGTQDDTDYKNVDDKKYTLQNQSLENRLDKSDNGGGVLEFTIPTQPTEQPHIDVRSEVISKAEVGVTQCNQGKGYVIDDKLDNNEWTENKTKTALDLQHTLPNGNQPPPVTNEIMDNQSEVTVVAKHEKLPELFGMGNKPEKQSENQYIETERNSQTGSSVDGNLPLVQNESAVCVSDGETIKRGSHDDTDYKNVDDKKDELQNQSLEDRLDKSDNGGGVLEFTIPTQPTEKPIIDVRPEVISKAEVGMTQCNQGKGFVIDDKLDNNEWTENKTKPALDLQHTLPNGNQPPSVTNEIMDNQSEVTDVAKHEFMGLCTHIFSIQKANREILKKLNLEESDRKNEEKQQLQQFSDLERILEHMEDKCRKKDKIILQLTRVVEQIYNKSLEIQQTNEIAPA